MWRPLASHVEEGKAMRQILAPVQPYPKHIMNGIVAASYVSNLAVPTSSLTGPPSEKASLGLIGQKFLQSSVSQHRRLSSIPGV
jgi:hypothetical protein